MIKTSGRIEQLVQGGRQMAKRTISPDPARKPIGYSPAVRVGNFVYVSGQLALGPNDEVVGGSDCHAQALQCFKNMETMLNLAGMSMSNVMKITAYLTHADHYPAYVSARAEVFAKDPPASSTVVVTALAVKGCLVEVEAVAAID
jgi:2-iminobutanoate/2-iminopropanoate deaminase